MAISTHLSIINLIVYILNSPINVECLHGLRKKKNKSHLYTAYKRLTSEDTHRLKVKGGKKTFHANGNKKKAAVCILISDTVYFKQRM